MVDQPSRYLATTAPTTSHPPGQSTEPTTDRGAPILEQLLRQPAFEVFPMTGVASIVSDLPRSVKVTVTCSPRSGLEATLVLVEGLAKQGFRVVPHISARELSDESHLQQTIQRLAAVDLREVFVIGGDAKQPAGPFDSALSLLVAMAEIGHDFEHVGIAGYPEGHPSVDEDRLCEALVDKQPFATYMVTQMCFNPETIVNWVAEMRRRGISLPVHIGVPGAAKAEKLLRFSLRIGVGDSIRFLTKHSGLLMRLTRPAYSPQALVEKVAQRSSARSLVIHGFHFYTFNEVHSMESWRQEMLDSIASAKGENGARTV